MKRNLIFLALVFCFAGCQKSESEPTTDTDAVAGDTDTGADTDAVSGDADLYPEVTPCCEDLVLTCDVICEAVPNCTGGCGQDLNDCGEVELPFNTGCSLADEPACATNGLTYLNRCILDHFATFASDGACPDATGDLEVLLQGDFPCDAPWPEQTERYDATGGWVENDDLDANDEVGSCSFRFTDAGSILNDVTPGLADYREGTWCFSFKVRQDQAALDDGQSWQVAFKLKRHMRCGDRGRGRLIDQTSLDPAPVAEKWSFVAFQFEVPIDDADGWSMGNGPDGYVPLGHYAVTVWGDPVGQTWFDDFSIHSGACK